MAVCASDAAAQAAREPFGGAGRAGAPVELMHLRVDAYRTLLASVAAPCNTRPPFLGTALRLFQVSTEFSCFRLHALDCPFTRL
jgi:hypothetical protein